jgi:hypothetical protein
MSNTTSPSFAPRDWALARGPDDRAALNGSIGPAFGASSRENTEVPTRCPGTPRYPDLLARQLLFRPKHWVIDHQHDDAILFFSSLI